jgi:transposase
MSTSERVQLWAMRGLTAAEITHQTKLPRSTVKYHLKRFKETGSWARREYPIRVKTLTPFADCIKKHLKLHPHASATELHELLANKYQLMVSVRTVQRYLKTAGREQKQREDLEAEDSDSSTTEELSVASGSDRSSSPKLKRIERHHGMRLNVSSSSESVMVSGKVATNIPAAIPNHSFGGPASLHPHFLASSHGALMAPPHLLPIPYGLMPPYNMMAPHSSLGWQDIPHSPTLPSNFHLMPPSLPLHFMPMYPQLPLPSEPALASPSTPAFVSAPTTPAPSSTPVTNLPIKPEPGLEALLNAALVSE